MKRIASLVEKEKSERRKKFIVGVVLIFLMVFSTAGFALSGLSSRNSGSQANKVNEVYNNGKYWVYTIGGQEFYFTEKLDQTGDIDFSLEKTLSDYQSQNIYVDSEDFEITQEIGNNLGRFAGRFQEACYGSCERDLPEKDCSDNLIVWKEKAEEKIYEEDNCIFIEGDIGTVDAFLYKVFGIN